METGYFFCGDLLGFTKIVKNLSQPNLDKKMDEWASLVSSCAQKNHIKKFQLLSDTIFAAVGQEKADLKNLINFTETY